MGCAQQHWCRQKPRNRPRGRPAQTRAKLNQIDGANILFLRAVSFIENTLPQATVILTMGFVGGPIRPDLKLPMIATRDIGAVAAEALLRLDFRGKQTQELLRFSISHWTVVTFLSWDCFNRALCP